MPGYVSAVADGVVRHQSRVSGRDVPDHPIGKRARTLAADPARDLTRNPNRVTLTPRPPRRASRHDRPPSATRSGAKRGQP